MSNLETSTGPIGPPVDPFADPVGFLAEHGIEAKLVEITHVLPEAA
jgi:hypothetical protein